MLFSKALSWKILCKGIQRGGEGREGGGGQKGQLVPGLNLKPPQKHNKNKKRELLRLGKLQIFPLVSKIVLAILILGEARKPNNWVMLYKFHIIIMYFMGNQCF